jgi:GTP-dependent phosphoenolpyruvate carboxykinase
MSNAISKEGINIDSTLMHEIREEWLQMMAHLAEPIELKAAKDSAETLTELLDNAIRRGEQGTP